MNGISQTNIVRMWPESTQIIATPSALFGRERVIFLDGGISKISAEMLTTQGPLKLVSAYEICKALLWLDKEKQAPIKLVIASQGGEVEAGFTILDTIQGLRSPLWILVWYSASFATLIATAGQKGHRYILPNATVHLHGPSMAREGKWLDVDATAEFHRRLNNKILDFLIERTQITRKVREINLPLTDWLEREFMSLPLAERKEEKKHQKEREYLAQWLHIERYLTPEEALDFGIVDQIISPKIQKEFFTIPEIEKGG